MFSLCFPPHTLHAHCHVLYTNKQMQPFCQLKDHVMWRVVTSTSRPHWFITLVTLPLDPTSSYTTQLYLLLSVCSRRGVRSTKKVRQRMNKLSKRKFRTVFTSPSLIQITLLGVWLTHVVGWMEVDTKSCYMLQKNQQVSQTLHCNPRRHEAAVHLQLKL